MILKTPGKVWGEKNADESDSTESSKKPGGSTTNAPDRKMSGAVIPSWAAIRRVSFQPLPVAMVKRQPVWITEATTSRVIAELHPKRNQPSYHPNPRRLVAFRAYESTLYATSNSPVHIVGGLHQNHINADLPD